MHLCMGRGGVSGKTRGGEKSCIGAPGNPGGAVPRIPPPTTTTATPPAWVPAPLTRLSALGVIVSVIHDPKREPDARMVMGLLTPVSFPQPGREGEGGRGAGIKKKKRGSGLGGGQPGPGPPLPRAPR